jgi:hypothetical protein
LARDDGGHLRPLDLDLRDDSSGYEPQNDTADTTFPERGSGAIGFLEGSPDAFSVTVDGAAPSTGETIGDSVVVYESVDAATDLVAAPTPQGAELMAQLRDDSAPETIGLHVDVPDGAELQQDGDGGAVIRQGPKQLAVITAPVAKDADGDAVTASMTVEGDRLIVSVAHHEDGVAYPVLVDPQINPIPQYYNWNQYWNFLGWAQYRTGSGSQYYELEGACTYGDFCAGAGMYIHASPGLWQAGSEAGFLYSVPHYTLADGLTPDNLETTTYIASADVGRERYYTDRGSPLLNPHLQYGIWDPIPPVGYLDRRELLNDPPGGFPQPTVDQVSAGDNLDAKQFRFNLFEPSNVSTFTETRRSALIGVITMNLFDQELPQVTLPQGNPLPTDWIDDESPGARGTLTADAYDGAPRNSGSVGPWGLGLQKFYLARSDRPQDVPPSTCDGTNYFPCPQFIRGRSWTFDSRDYPEGATVIAPLPIDALGRTPDPGFAGGLLIDRTPPTFDLHGDLADNGVEPGTQGYTLWGTADDGNGATLEQWRSGVKTLDLYVDGQLKEHLEQTRAQCPLGSCSLGRTQQSPWTFDPAQLGEGRHRFSIVATDFLGHVLGEDDRVRPAEDRSRREHARAPEAQSDRTDQPLGRSRADSRRALRPGSRRRHQALRATPTQRYDAHRQRQLRHGADRTMPGVHGRKHGWQRRL